MKQIEHNPDVLNCLANLSNDEVFTPPALVNQMLDLLPQELFSDPNSTFLDPFTKTAVFLREIVKRLDKGLETIIPDRQERIDHILHKQVFGMAVTELTSLLSRRTLYCSKFANGEHSISHFETAEGNIWYKPLEHSWVIPKRKGREKDEDYEKKIRCKICGAPYNIYGRGAESEQYAYPFIHLTDLKSIYNMKFSVICGNPPYMLKDGGAGASAIPIYNLFMNMAISLSPDWITMITPSRWYAGGKGLDSYRERMINDDRFKVMVNFINGKECFPSSSTGSVNYFLWGNNYHGLCTFTSVLNGKVNTKVRALNEFNVLVGNNIALDIIHKVLAKKENSFCENVFQYMPFGLRSYERGFDHSTKNSIKFVSSGGEAYISLNSIPLNKEIVPIKKVMASYLLAEHAGEPDKQGKYKVLSRLEILDNNSACSESYLILFASSDDSQVENCLSYCKTKFFRFLLLQCVSSIHLKKELFQFVPNQDFTKEISDEQLYDKYDISDDEIAYIEELIKPME